MNGNNKESERESGCASLYDVYIKERERDRFGKKERKNVYIVNECIFNVYFGVHRRGWQRWIKERERERSIYVFIFKAASIKDG